jgi:hypothetical protein
MKLNKYSALLTGFFVSSFIYYLEGIRSVETKDLPINLMFSVSNGVLALLGGGLGLLIARHWGGTKSAVGKALLLISLGTTSWGLGNAVWSFYNFVYKEQVPYPSFADLGFALAIPLWAVGVFYLSKATGARFSIQKTKGRLLIIILPILAALFSYYFLFVVARDSSFVIEGDWLKIFLDFYYPLGDWVILTMSFLVFGLSLKYLGGRFRWPIYILLLGFVAMFIGDFSFSYTTTIGTYYNGSIADLLLAFGLYIISFGVTSLDVSEDS